MGYFKDTAKGISWMTAYRILYRTIGFIRIGILARLLSPIEFGSFGIAILALGSLEIFSEIGINVFLIQEKESIDEYINTAWIISIFRGLIISAVIYISAPYVSSFLKSPNSLSLLYLVAIVPFIKGFINPAIVKFQKELLFNKEFFYRISVFFVESISSIVCVLVTRNAISMVWGLIAGAIYEVIFTFLVSRPRPIFAFNSLKFRKIISRGKWVTSYGIFDYLYTQSDNLVVAKMLGEGSLGIYQNAYKISTTPLTEIGDVFFKVTFPVFSRITQEKERLKKAFIKNTLVNSVLMLPAGLIIFLFAEQIVLLILGPNWTSAIPVVKLLSVLGVVRGIANSTNSLLVAVQRQKDSTVITVVSTLGLWLSIVPLVSKFGIIGAGIAAIIGVLLSLPFTVFFVLRTFRFLSE